MRLFYSANVYYRNRTNNDSNNNNKKWEIWQKFEYGWFVREIFLSVMSLDPCKIHDEDKFFVGLQLRALNEYLYNMDIAHHRFWIPLTTGKQE